jgi:hypothetical protein
MIGTRVTPDLKQRLEAAAEHNGHSQAQEIELRLQRSFDREEIFTEVLKHAYGRELAALLLEIGSVMDLTGRLAAFDATRTLESWTSNTFAYKQAVQGAAHILRKRRPRGPIVPPKPAHFVQSVGEDIEVARATFERYRKWSGRIHADTMMDAVDGKSETTAFGDKVQTVRQLRKPS